MRKHNLYLIIISISAIFLVSALSIVVPFIVKDVQATAPNPAWWLNNNGLFSQYDTYQYRYGHTHQGIHYDGAGVDPFILDSNATYDGVAAIGPLPGQDGDAKVWFTPDADAIYQWEWQCPELVKRFLYLEYGLRALGADGYDVVDTYSRTYPTIVRKVLNDGSTQEYPKAGDILSYSSYMDDPGHTALVKSVTGQSSGSATVDLIEQNSSSSGITHQTFNNWQFQNGIDDNPNDPHTVSGWLTPKKGSWTNTGQMQEAISKHTAILLPDGKVLVAGGYRSSYSVTNRAELYNPSTGTWSYTTGNLNAGRYGHTADLVTVSGGATRVLVTGGYGTTYLTSSELYNPSTGTWSLAQNMQNARYYHLHSAYPS